MSKDDVCHKCKKPIHSSSGGMVTQFIDICHCIEIPQEQFQTIQICATCGMRIAQNSGSLTQWIFGKGICQCLRPEPVETAVEEFINPSFIGFRDGNDEAELTMDADKFPSERYKAIAKLGSGASGVVYLSRDRLLGKKVAVKTLLDLNPEQLIAFQEEAKATAKLNHPNIIKVLDFGASESGIPFMVMDYIAGISLEKYLEKNNTLTEGMARTIFIKLASALAYAHEQGIYHRDIKPSNILLYESDDDIEVCLIDFGIAKVKEASGLITQYQK